jgi:hypothetical protein
VAREQATSLKLPQTELVAQLCDRAHSDADQIARLWPLVREHYRRGGPRFPAGAEGGGHPEGVHSDPTADTVLAALERPPEPEVLDRRALLFALDALGKLDQARKALEARIPAQAAALRMGQSAHDGRTEAEIIALRQHRRATNSGSACLVCDEIAHPLPSGMCQKHYMQWYRSRGGSDDPREFIARKRAELRAEWDESRHMTVQPRAA